ncbi:6-phosphofructokinase 1 [Anaerohalosphaera lusitana]|uniref:Pyrophosphate--fructose 6-phosphate 1-phosphotransferase n=1 Tax=Anaerohalosphaera lusitana TaxID=1936003 RepID=A0A1U9NL46_9BACT|nr:6-phosphofructokinase [Anaerohalosphaera lusitana]AQT68629.1 6-phosphofructokinase 1 [Anaerohalosphaera lusitana]
MSSKANAIIAQSGGPTTAINSSACGAIEAAMKSDKIGRVYGATNGILGVLQEDIFDISSENPKTISMLKRTPAAAIGSCRYKLKSLEESKEDYERILDVFKAHDIHYFFYIGGNDSMDTADKVNKLASETGYDLTCVGIPKTIDNDLACTDHCPGYGSVAKYVATCAMEAGKDTEALYTTDTCTILEVMGRNAGWIAASAGLARREPEDAPHLIYLPEVAFEYDKFVSDVKGVLNDFKRVFIVAGEGLRDKDGEYITSDTGSFSKDSFGHKQLGGVAETLKDIVEREVGIKARFNKLGTNQRSAMHFASLTDIEESYMCGNAAVEAALSGVSGKMVTLVREDGSDYSCTTGLANLSDVANGEKIVPREFINEAGNGVTDAMLDYVRPLVQGEAPVSINEDGLPVFMRFERKPVDKKLPSYK